MSPPHTQKIYTKARRNRDIVMRDHINADGKPKKGFRDRQKAESAARIIRESATQERMHVYKCRVCGRYHIGHDHQN